MSGTDKLWLIVNTADYVCGLMIDSYLYSMYEKEITQSYVEGHITSIGEFHKYLDDFIDRYASDYQIDELLNIVNGVEQLANTL